MPSLSLPRHQGRLLLALSVAACATSAAPGDTTPIHDWATDPFAPPQSEAPEHVAQMYAGIDHEVLAGRAKVKDAEHAAARSAQAARRAVEDKSPEAFLRRVRSFEPGSYELLFKCADVAPNFVRRSCLTCARVGCVLYRCRDRIMDFELSGMKPADHQGTLHLVDGQRVKIEGDVRLPWNGRFEVKGPDAYLELVLLTLRRQRGAQNGVVYNRGGQVRLDRVEFHDNAVSGDGGAVAATGATSHTVVDNCDFHQNHAGGAGGAVAVRGAGAQLVVTGSHFLRNHGQRGGAVAVLEGGTATISNCKFHLNTAGLLGGGVFIAHTAGQGTVLRRAELAANSAGNDIAGAYQLRLGLAQRFGATSAPLLASQLTMWCATGVRRYS